jgi:hypothetical protein
MPGRRPTGDAVSVKPTTPHKDLAHDRVRHASESRKDAQAGLDGTDRHGRTAEVRTTTDAGRRCRFAGGLHPDADPRRGPASGSPFPESFG